MYKLLISRRFAIYLLTAVLLVLVASALVPPGSALSARLATPVVVSSPLFQVVSFLLCLSTLACTVDRVWRWGKSRTLQFEKEKAFSFSVTRSSRHGCDAVAETVQHFLSRGRWETARERNPELTVISGQKGMSGFWGSVLFHLGLVCCFLAAPVTSLTGFRGELTVTGDVAVPLKEAIVAHQGYHAGKVPEAQVEVNRLRGEFFKGEYRYDFGGELSVSDRQGTHRLPFAVNHPTSYRGYQFSLSEYGNAPRLVLARGAAPFFDYYLNLKNPREGDYFDLEPGVRAQVMFFPDFFRDGDKIGSRSQRPDNPMTLVRIFRGEREVFKTLLKPGDEERWEDARISFPDYRHWVTLIVAREQGVLLVIVGSLLGAVGLLVRFLSNERRIEFEVSRAGEETSLRVRGYSRYYPAFLEKEVLEIARELEAGQGA